MLIAFAFPVLQPLGLPIPISSTTKAAYSAIEAIPAGSAVWYVVDCPAMSVPEALPGMVAFARHLFSKPVRTMFLSFVPEGPMVYLSLLPLFKIPAEKKYGIDYVFMGYLPGDETALAAVASDVRGALKADFYGTSIDSLPALKGINTAKDFQLVIGKVSLSVMKDAYLRQINARFGVKLVWVMDSGGYPSALVYYPQQIVGMLNGLKGGAEYEVLTGFLGTGASGMDALTISQLLLVTLVVIGNVSYLARKKQKPKGGT
jgi:hypothetical protein